MSKAGANRQAIVNAYARELPVDPEKRRVEIEKNIQLVKRSKGLLAPVEGCERYETLGSGHTTVLN